MNCAKKRGRQSQWPGLFDITPLAKLIIGFVPKIQVKQWMRECSGTLQRDLCSWIPKQDIDTEIYEAIIATDNALCTQYFPSLETIKELIKIDMVGDMPIPNILSTLPFSDYFAYFAPLCNLKVLVKHSEWTKEKSVSLIRFQVAFDPSKELLEFLLSLVDTKVEIGDELGDCFWLDRWNTCRSFIESGQCTIDSIHPKLLAEMPLAIFQSLPELCQNKCRDRAFFAMCISKFNWDLASFVWKEEFTTEMEMRLNSRFADIVDTNQYLKRCSDDSNFNCAYPWSEDLLFKHDAPDHDRLNSILQFVNEYPIRVTHTSRATLKDALCAWVSRLFSDNGIECLTRIFRVSCAFGYYHTVRAIWNFVGIKEQQYLRSKINDCRRFCDNVETLEFAWSVIEDDIRTNVLQWVRCAYNSNNRVLWKFICDKQLLDPQLLLDEKIVILFQTAYGLEATNIAQSLGNKKLDFIKLIWSLPEIQSQETIDGMFHNAILANNEPVLWFLNDTHARISQNVILSHLNTICHEGLMNILRQFIWPPHIETSLLYDCYAKASESARELLWCFAPLQDSVHFLDNTWNKKDMCIFLMDKHAISAQLCITALKRKENPNTDLINDIQAHTYCDADNV